MNIELIFSSALKSPICKNVLHSHETWNYPTHSFTFVTFLMFFPWINSIVFVILKWTHALIEAKTSVGRIVTH